MRLSLTRNSLFFFLALAVSAGHAADTSKSAHALIKAAIDHWRDVSSTSITDMTIHRPDWERTLTIRVWTRGQKESLVRVLAPAKDAGNATLLLDNEMWSFNPKVNRVIKIPSSMMNQSWMGSDFSNNDLAKADDLLEQYRHSLLSTETRAGHTVYVVQSVPFDTAPVVWGKEVIAIRDDHVMLEHSFYDQAGALIKKMTTREIKEMGGKLVATRQRMDRLDKKDEWTEIHAREARFGVAFPDLLFTQASLRNLRE
jgi:outer membrane lipoprotein-sorting protein